MIGWDHWLSGHEFEQTLGDSEGQESLACLRSWGRQELDMTQRLNNKNEIRVHYSSETQVSLETTSTEFLIL